MSQFIYNSYCVEHPASVPTGRQVGKKSVSTRFAFKRSAVLLSAALMAALMVVASQLSDSWSEGPMLGAWMLLWVLAMGAAVLFSTPARRAAVMARSGYRAWVEARQQAAADERTWNAALLDARLMADLARAMDRQQR